MEVAMCVHYYKGDLTENNTPSGMTDTWNELSVKGWLKSGQGGNEWEMATSLQIRRRLLLGSED